MKPAKKLKLITQMAKSLHPMLTRIPNPLPRPSSEAYRTKGVGDPKADTKRREAFAAADVYRLDKATVRFWATPYGGDSNSR